MVIAQERSAVLRHTRARSRAKKGGALEAYKTPLRYISGLAKDTVLSTSSRTPESRVVFHDHLGEKRGVWLALAGVLELFFTFG